jgi:hypothetical protein
VIITTGRQEGQPCWSQPRTRFSARTGVHKPWGQVLRNGLARIRPLSRGRKSQPRLWHSILASATARLCTKQSNGTSHSMASHSTLINMKTSAPELTRPANSDCPLKVCAGLLPVLGRSCFRPLSGLPGEYICLAGRAPEIRVGTLAFYRQCARRVLGLQVDDDVVVGEPIVPAAQCLPAEFSTTASS